MTNAPCTTPAATEDLIETLDRFNDELQSISDLLEQIRTDFAWGLQNGRVAFVLSEPKSLDEFRDVTTGADTLTLAIRFHVALGQLREQLIAAIEGSDDPLPVAESTIVADEVKTEDEAVVDRPPIELFEVGDAVEFDLDGETYFGEIAALDDAENIALVQLIPSFEEVEVPQDLLTRIEPDELSRREEIWTQIMDQHDETLSHPQQPAVGDRVRLNLHGHKLEGEINDIHRMMETADVVLTPSMETVTIDWSELIPVESSRDDSGSVLQETLEPLEDRWAEHEQWCREVRDPALANSEGVRTIEPANKRAEVQYEIAPLPDGRWAVWWSHRFHFGTLTGASHPWTACATRQACLDLVLKTSRAMFATPTINKLQIPVAREMLHLLGDGLFGFVEPEPEPV
ncbi:MAG: hypothetical protein KDA52_23115, partial [Planctomycetaceae bacterium]|nr:hypothetical protein [Planctomycetaceae bacterium]